ncbi:MAG: filamentous hemagglutinin N-terminal domain-containing protein, partial [Burkholderiales bacterium]|nr:filamentous hemagglutinin N-terminal domain-containing protein [Burkholderiales bacterium]
MALALASMGAGAQQAVPGATLPTGGRVVGGQAAISQSGATMAIQQSSARAAIDWQSFSIGAQASVVFRQPSASSIALNRVIGADPSQIFGRLSANGQVFLTNPSGILFAPGAQVDVGGIVASTLQMSADDFMSGRYLLRGNGTSAAVTNQGTIRALPKGYVALIAPAVVNEGTIEAPRGTAALVGAGAATVGFMADGLIQIRVDQGALNAEVANRGAVRADGGAVLLTAKGLGSLGRAVVNNSGIIEARTVENVDGVIRLGGGTVENAGAIRGAKEIALAGDEVRLLPGSEITAAPQGTVSVSTPGLAALHGTVDAGTGGRLQVDAGTVMSSGVTRAEGGRISLNASAVYLDGRVDASSPSAPGGAVELRARSVDVAASGVVAADGTQGGDIHIESTEGGRVLVSGELSAQGSAGEGGRIRASAWNLSMLGGSADASGTTRGGRILFGGGRGGDGGEVPLSDHAMISPGSRFRARGAQGGEIILYGSNSLDMYGDAEAQGAPGSRDGGFIELSSAGSWRLASQAKIDAGPGGTVFIDPKNITIDASGADVTGAILLALKLGSGSQTSSGPGALSLADQDLLGSSVAFSADRLAVGAEQDATGGSNRGAVYLFDGIGSSGTIGTPRLAAKLAHGSALASGGASATLLLSDGDKFGRSVALAADRLAVGAPNDDIGGTDRGAVYLFDSLGSSGALSIPRMALKLAHGTALSGSPTTLDLSGPEPFLLFGHAVALSGGWLAVSAPASQGGQATNNTGAVYLFDGLGSSGAISTPHQAIKLEHGTALASGTLSIPAGGLFGHSVALHADRLAVGSGYEDGGRGAVRLFHDLDNSGSLQAPQQPMVLANGTSLDAGGIAGSLSLNVSDSFGTSVSLSADRLAVGSGGDDTGGQDRGAVFLFNNLNASGSFGTPRLLFKLADGSSLAAGGAASSISLSNDSYFGQSVALAADRLVVGQN